MIVKRVFAIYPQRIKRFFMIRNARLWKTTPDGAVALSFIRTNGTQNL
jgi:hypothetical protein